MVLALGDAVEVQRRHGVGSDEAFEREHLLHLNCAHLNRRTKKLMDKSYPTMCHMRRRIHVSYEEEDTCVTQVLPYLDQS